MACLNCFHASVTRQRSTGSETRFSRSHVHEKKPTLANKGSRKRTWWRPTITTNSNRESGNTRSPLLRLYRMFKTLETLHKLEECTSGCSDGSSKQQSRTLRYKNTGKNTCSTRVCRIKGNRTVALSLQTKIVRTTDVLNTTKKRR